MAENTPPDARAALSRLLEIMARLRDPAGGCPWDLEQNFATIAPYTIEEAYEVADAIESGDMAALRDELGDLLLQVVFHAQMAAEAGAFTFADVAEGIAIKMIRRHPHVFGDAHVADAAAQTARWEEIKATERAQKREESQLDGIPSALPALMRAQKLQSRAARVGFDWPDLPPVIAKVEEELGEVRGALDAGDAQAVAEEIGDLLFSAVNLARKAGVDSEEALRAANRKFTRRFRAIEQAARASEATLDTLSLAALEALWQEAKAQERTDAAA